MNFRPGASLLIVFLGLAAAGASARSAGWNDLRDRADRAVTRHEYGVADSLYRVLRAEMTATPSVDAALLATTLLDHAECQIRMGQLTGSEATIRAALTAIGGRDLSVPRARAHVGLAETSFQKAEWVSSSAHLDTAEAVLGDALAAEIRIRGDILLKRGLIQIVQGDWTAADSSLNATCDLMDRHLPVSDPWYKRAYNALGAVYYRQQRFEESRFMFEAAILQESRQEHPDYLWIGRIRQNIADLLFQQDRYEESEVDALKALALFAEHAEPDDVVGANTETLLGEINLKLDRYAEAEYRLMRGASLREEAWGPDSPNLLYSYNGLANYYKEVNRWPEALEYYDKAYRVGARGLGEVHLDLAMILTNEGDCYHAMGLSGEAIETYRRALAIWERLDQPGSEWARTQMLLGGLLGSRGDAAAAERLFRAAEDAFGQMDEPPADKLATFDLLRGEQALREGDHAAAQRLLTAALAGFEKVYDPDNSHLSEPLLAIARLQAETGRREEALATYLRAQDICERSSGGSDRLVRVLDEFGAFLVGQDDPLAMELSEQAFELQRQSIALTLEGFPEDSALRIAGGRRAGLAAASRVALRSGDGHDAARVWHMLLQSRGALFDALYLRGLITDEARNSELSRLADEVRAAAARLATLQKKTPASAAGRQKNASLIAEAAADHDAAQLRYGAASARYSQSRSRDAISLAAVARKMPRRSALVAIYRQELGDDQDNYLVFVQRQGERFPSLRRIGNAAAIDTLVVRWRHALFRARREESDWHGDDTELALGAQEAGAALRERVWAPVAGEVADRELVFVVPDGSLAGINFTALPSRQGRYLVEDDLTIQHLVSEKDLVADLPAPSRGRALLVGNPEFGLPIAGDDAPQPAVEALQPLPGAADEIGSVAAIMGDAAEVTVLMGAGATEAAVRAQARTSRVLHFATHGWTLPAEDTARRRGIGTLNPMEHTGLALAGADHWQAAGSSRNDGILTAAEVALLELDACEWVVLSSCGSGLGKQAANEGVLGMCRAFRQAGARTVVLTLWDVDDEAARQWIVPYYEARLERRKGSAAAAKHASVAMLEARRRAGKRTLPYDWAAFVTVGEWR